MTAIENIIRDAAETLRSNHKISRCSVFEEDKGDIAKNVETEIAKTNLAVVVGWNGWTAQIVGATAPSERPFGSVTVVVTIFERPVINRSDETSPRLLELAREVAIVLDGAASEGMDDVMHLKRISPIVEIGRGVVSCDVEFETKATL